MLKHIINSFSILHGFRRPKILNFRTMHWLRYLVFGFVVLAFAQCAENSGGEDHSEGEKIDSLDLLTKEISLNPDDIDARKQRAEIFHKNHAFGAALKDIEHALTIDSESMLYKIGRAQV